MNEGFFANPDDFDAWFNSLPKGIQSQMRIEINSARLCAEYLEAVKKAALQVLETIEQAKRLDPQKASEMLQSAKIMSKAQQAENIRMMWVIEWVKNHNAQQ